MSTLISHITASPYGKDEECAQFTINDVQEQFTVFDVMSIGEEYTYSCWLKSDESGIITIHGTTIETTPNWERHAVTFTADKTDMVIEYDAAGVYYIYHPKLELGNMATDWTVAVEDTEESLKDASNAASIAQSTADAAEQRIDKAELSINEIENTIRSLVVDKNGTSMMTQTSTGWVFSFGSTLDELETLNEKLSESMQDIIDTSNQVEKLGLSAEKFERTANYVRIDESGSQPYIVLGKEGSDFKVVITNTDIRFLEGSYVPAHISNQSLHIKKAVIEEELTQGGFQWIVRKDSNGNPRNMGLVWKGVT